MRRGRLLAGLIFVVVIVVGWWRWWTPVEVVNEMAGERFEVSAVRVNVYLWANGYGNPGEKLRIVYTDQAQEGVVYGGEWGVWASMGARVNGKTTELWLHYSKEALDGLRGRMGEFDRQLYGYLCVGLDENKPDPLVCFERAGTYMERVADGWGEMVRLNQGRSWRLVGQAWAQSCGGRIPCGGWSVQCSCSVSGYDHQCSRNGAACGPSDAGTCSGCRTVCDTSLNNINCSSLGSETLCNNNGGIGSCGVSCNNSADNFCSWGGGGTIGCSTSSQCPGGQCCRNSTCTTNCGGPACDPSFRVYCPAGTTRQAQILRTTCVPRGQLYWCDGYLGDAQTFVNPNAGHGDCNCETIPGECYRRCPACSITCEPDSVVCEGRLINTHACTSPCAVTAPTNVRITPGSTYATALLEWTPGSGGI